MATRIPTAVRNAEADLVVDRVDAGAGPGTVKVYTGTQPATANDAATGTLIVTIPLNDPAYGTAGATTAGVAALSVATAPSATAISDGTPGWYRVADSTGTTVFDGSLTGVAAILSGDTVSITAGTFTAPAST